MPSLTASTKPAPAKALLRQMVADARAMQGEPDIIQAAVCAAPILASSDCGGAAIRWLHDQLEPWEQDAFDQALTLSTEYLVLSSRNSRLTNQELAAPSTAHLFEHFLHQHSRAGRKRGGVFFTPQPIADHIVHSVDHLLRDQFSLPAGLADRRVTIIDPACGTGVFLLAAIDYFAERSLRIETLLPRLIGIEILPAAAFLTKLNLTLKFAEAGADFQDLPRINVITGDALSPNLQSEICNWKFEVPVLIGNPPFSSLSTTTNDWISRLVRGDEEIRGYVRANGQSLGERKTWLHDDYVKFIRLAQWHIEQAGCGIVGFVTNHGFLDNATFRLMRHELLRVFSHIEIIDLHGNRKKQEQSPNGSPDENVFGLDQGVAMSLLAKRTGDRGHGTVNGTTLQYSELWGSRTSKLTALLGPSPNKGVRLEPQIPDWFLVPNRRPNPHTEYDTAWSLTDAMPLHTTAPVTARDHFVVAFTAEELRARIDQFRDLSIPDDEIRRRYFHRTRSARYQSGDTRGWKLAEARRIVASDRDWQQKITRCLYRPFDWRYVFWHPAMIDWPRTEVTRCLIHAGQRDGVMERKRDSEFESLRPSVPPSLPLCLVARRQQLPTHPCTFFWISDGLALDGIIRSDNRGSESLFPLYQVAGTIGVPSPPLEANFARAFIDDFAAAVCLDWLPHESGDLARTFGPEDLLAYIYALFHSPTYRETYADALRRDFPRILAPSSSDLFARMSSLGATLIALHLLRSADSVFSTQYSVRCDPTEPTAATLSSAHATLPPSISNFRAGGYVALRKWLQPRHRSTTNPQYARIVAAISRTNEIMAAIDAAIDQSGGWPSAFATKHD